MTFSLKRRNFTKQRNKFRTPDTLSKNQENLHFDGHGCGQKPVRFLNRGTFQNRLVPLLSLPENDTAQK